MVSPSPDLGPYALKAERHWRTFLPGDYEQIPPRERTAFFTRIGEEIEERIQALTEQLTPDEPAEPASYLGGLADLMTARAQAEQEVLAEMLPTPPDQDEEDPEEQEDSAGS